MMSTGNVKKVFYFLVNNHVITILSFFALSINNRVDKNFVLNSQPKLHAYDIHRTLSDNLICNIDPNLNEDLSRVSNRLTANKRSLNLLKTELALTRVGPRRSRGTFDCSPSLEIDGTPINKVTFFQTFGVYIV